VGLDGVPQGDRAVVDLEDVLGFGADVDVEVLELLVPDEAAPVAFAVAVDEGLVFRHDGSEGFALGVGEVLVERRRDDAVLGDLLGFVHVVDVFGVLLFLLLAEVLVPAVVLGFLVLVEGQGGDVVGLEAELAV